MRSLKPTAILLLPALVLCACATEPQPVAINRPKVQLAPVPAYLLTPEEPNFRCRLLNFFSAKPVELTKSCSGSTPAKPSSGATETFSIV
ncbi:putative lipoprotein [Burkholderia pseudomallei ABCPW 1]|nr:putative lipoprotein [Burkholderia pseudomallei ABCPW 1]